MLRKLLVIVSFLSILVLSSCATTVGVWAPAPVYYHSYPYYGFYYNPYPYPYYHRIPPHPYYFNRNLYYR